MVKSLEFFSKAQQVPLEVNFFFRFGQILLNLTRIFAVHRENSFFPAFLRSLLITYLIVYLFVSFFYQCGSNAEHRMTLVFSD